MSQARARSVPPVTPRFAVRAADVQVEEVAGARAKDEFIRFQLDHYVGDENFVPPIVAERREFLDPKQNPFFEDARAAFFLARRHGKVVGRVAAIVDDRYNRFHGTHDGFVGFFESQNDPGLAAALFEAACGWLKREGMKRCIGPINLAFHNEAGVQVHGNERFPAMLMPYNPPFYGVLFEANGFTKLKDLYSYEVLAIQGMPEKVRRLAERVKQGVVKVRRLDLNNPETDLSRMQAILPHHAEAGLRLRADEPRGVHVDRRDPLAAGGGRGRPLLMAEVDGEVVGFAITVPDTHLARRKRAGTCSLSGAPKMLWKARSIVRLRGLLLRSKMVGAAAASTRCWRQRLRAGAHAGYQAGELGWAMEDDTLVNRMLQATGAKHVKTFRIYQRPL